MEHNKIDEVQNKILAAIAEVKELDSNVPMSKILRTIWVNGKGNDIKRDIAMIREIDEDKRFFKKLIFVLERYV